MKKTRNQSIDFLRGIAVILVVVGHAVQLANGLDYRNSGVFYEEPVYRFIYGFHMPLFHLISGYLAAYSFRAHDWKNEISKKAVQLGLPIITWGVIQFLVERLRPGFAIRPYQLIVAARDCLESNWFLWSVLIAYVLVGIGHYALKDHWLYYAVIVVLMFVTSDEYNFKMYKFVFVFFLTAYLYNMHRLEQPKRTDFTKKNYRMIGGICLLAYMILLRFFHENQYIYTSGFTLLSRDNAAAQLGIDVFRTMLGFFGSLAAICAVQYLFLSKEGTWLQKRIAVIGIRSIGIYLISGILLGYGFRRFFTSWTFSYPRTMVVALLIVIFCDVTIAVIERFPKLSILFFGRK